MKGAGGIEGWVEPTTIMCKCASCITINHCDRSVFIGGDCDGDGDGDGGGGGGDGDGGGDGGMFVFFLRA